MNKRSVILATIGVFATAILLWPKRAIASIEAATSADYMFGDVIPGNPYRGCDSQGCGAYKASRGTREHEGLDIAATVGSKAYTPIAGTVTRQTRVYASDSRYTGIVIAGTGYFVGYEVKVFYIGNMPMAGTMLPKGAVIGFVQNIAAKYPGLKNHIHIEIRKNGTLIDPTLLIK
jgi:hypothetical protein